MKNKFITAKDHIKNKKREESLPSRHSVSADLFSLGDH